MGKDDFHLNITKFGVLHLNLPFKHKGRKLFSFKFATFLTNRRTMAATRVARAYLDDYFEAVHDLPNAMQRDLSLMWDLDVQYARYMIKLEKAMEDLLDQVETTGLDIKQLKGKVVMPARAEEEGDLEKEVDIMNGIRNKRLLSSTKLSLQKVLQKGRDIGNQQVKVSQSLFDKVEDQSILLNMDKKKVLENRPVQKGVVTRVGGTGSLIRRGGGPKGMENITIAHVFPSLVKARKSKDDSDLGSSMESTMPLTDAEREDDTDDSVASSESSPKRKIRKVHLNYNKKPKLRHFQPHVEGESDSDTEGVKYCFCNRGSFGSMIGCDSDLCPWEWFHLGCVTFPDEPHGKWYCPRCREEERPHVRKPRSELYKELELYNQQMEVEMESRIAKKKAKLEKVEQVTIKQELEEDNLEAEAQEDNLEAEAQEDNLEAEAQEDNLEAEAQAEFEKKIKIEPDDDYTPGRRHML